VTEIVCAEKLLVYLGTSPDFRVSITNSVEDDINLRVPTGSLAAIDRGCRRRR